MTTFPENTYFSAEVHGKKGGILLDSALNGEMRVFGEGVEERLAAVDNTIHNVVEDVVSAVERGTRLRVDGREGRRTVALWNTFTTRQQLVIPLTLAAFMAGRIALIGGDNPHAKGWLETASTCPDFSEVVYTEIGRPRRQIRYGL